MCGVLGWIGSPKDSEIDKLKELTTELFKATEVRGMHASGYAALVKDSKGGTRVSFSKLPVTARTFVDHDRYYNDFWFQHPTVFIGHCRFATSGDPKINKNNHPFSGMKGNMWMVHNGIANGVAVPKILMKTQCDSEAIIRLMDIHGFFGGVKKLVNSVADFACLFLSKKGMLHAIRNDCRPLYYALWKEMNVVLLFSTTEIFEAACKASGISVDEFEVFECEVNTLYSFHTDLRTRTKEFKVTPKVYRSIWDRPAHPYIPLGVLNEVSDDFIEDYEVDQDTGFIERKEKKRIVLE